jgi:hypothetical protein
MKDALITRLCFLQSTTMVITNSSCIKIFIATSLVGKIACGLLFACLCLSCVPFTLSTQEKATHSFGYM